MCEAPHRPTRIKKAAQARQFRPVHTPGDGDDLRGCRCERDCGGGGNSLELFAGEQRLALKYGTVNASTETVEWSTRSSKEEVP
jgi:hypothetical protein